MDEVEEVRDFYDAEVPQYEAVENHAGPFNSALYMGSGFDTTAAETLDTEVRHVDTDPMSIDFLERNGYEAERQDVTRYSPEENFDLVILSHLPTQQRPLIEENLSEDGTVICRTKARARKLERSSELDLQAVYDESRKMVEQRHLVSAPETELYLFR